MKKESSGLSRRRFLQIGGAAVGGSTLSFTAGCDRQEEPRIRQYRMLGRTGFECSDIAVGGLTASGDVIRYAYDKGVNYFDTAEAYGRGLAERRIGDAMPFLDRKKIWITTKLKFDLDTTEEEILERYRKCLERMKTDYADALFIHGMGLNNVAMVKHAGYHSAIEKLKAEGRVKHAGLSCHGPRGEGDSMQKVLTAAAEDGRFDLMLMVYNFMNFEEAENVLAVCKEKNIGTVAMKTSPGMIKVEEFDPENMTAEQADMLTNVEERSPSREVAIQRIRNDIEKRKALIEQTRPFAEKYGVTTNEQLRKVSLQWVLSNPAMHTVCMRLWSFEGWDEYLPLSGTSLDQASTEFLDDFKLAYDDQYCRHGCTACADACPEKLPVSTIMRYSYYFSMQRMEKHAMGKYAALKDRNASVCRTCSAPCADACPHGLNIQAHLRSAHSMLTLV